MTQPAPYQRFLKIPALLLALGSLLSTAHAQTAPAKPQPVRTPAGVATPGRAIGRNFVVKSEPNTSSLLLRVQPKKQ